MNDGCGVISSDGWYDKYCSERAMVKELNKKVVDIEAELGLANGCLEMVKEALETIGIDMSACPPMMYPEAICKAIAMCIKEDREKVRAMRGEDECHCDCHDKGYQ